MAWHTEGTGNSIVIRNGNRVVGSIVKGDICNRWFVEILWSRPGSDIKGEFASYNMALAFVEGVEKTFAAMAKTNVKTA
jgi:hypothetical protein